MVLVPSLSSPSCAQVTEVPSVSPDPGNATVTPVPGPSDPVGCIRGRVTLGGAALSSGVSIKLINGETGVFAFPEEGSGNYSFSGLAYGNYPVYFYDNYVDDSGFHHLEAFRMVSVNSSETIVNLDFSTVGSTSPATGSPYSESPITPTPEATAVVRPASTWIPSLPPWPEYTTPTPAPGEDPGVNATGSINVTETSMPSVPADNGNISASGQSTSKPTPGDADSKPIPAVSPLLTIVVLAGLAAIIVRRH